MTKNVITVEGGIVVCRDPALAERITVAALHGMSKDAWMRCGDDGFVHYDVVEPTKYNLTDLAAFGIHQLARVERLWHRRQQLWDFYLRELADLPLVLPAPWPANVRHALHLFTCLVDDARTRVTRDQVPGPPHQLRIGAGVHYRGCTCSNYRRTYGHREGDLPTAEWIGARTFSIPFSAAVTDEDAADVVRALHAVFDG